MAFFTSQNTVIMVISTPYGAEEAILRNVNHRSNNDWDAIIFNGTNFERWSAKSNAFLFILVNQDRTIWQAVKDPVMKTLAKQGKHLIIWSHSTGGPNCRDIVYGQLLRCINFNHGSHEIESFMEGIAQAPNSFCEKADVLISRNIDYHAFRSHIMTPLIPIHLFLQVDSPKSWSKILETSKSTLTSDAIGNALINLLDLRCIAEGKNYYSSINNDLKDKIIAQFEKMKQKVKDGSIQTNEIKQFADCLESVVTFIEFGEEIQCL